MFQFNVWPSALQQRMGGYPVQDWEHFQCSSRACTDLCSELLQLSSSCLNEHLLWNPQPRAAFCSPCPDLCAGCHRADAIPISQPWHIHPCSVLGGCHCHSPSCAENLMEKTLSVLPAAHRWRFALQNSRLSWFSHSQLSACSLSPFPSFSDQPGYSCLLGLWIQLHPWHEEPIFPNLLCRFSPFQHWEQIQGAGGAVRAAAWCEAQRRWQRQRHTWLWVPIVRDLKLCGCGTWGFGRAGNALRGLFQPQGFINSIIFSTQPPVLEILKEMGHCCSTHQADFQLTRVSKFQPDGHQHSNIHKKSKP